jgi:hypothetical protein
VCRSCADGGRRCHDHRRLRQVELDELRPVDVDGLPAVDWGPDPAGPAQLYERYPDPVAGAAVSSLRYLREVEPEMTADICWALPKDARPHGLAFRMKSPGSLARKIESRVALSDYDEVTTYDVAEKMTDLVRYTGVASHPDEVVSMARSTLRRLKRRGWEVIEVEHSYVEGNPYKGLHTLVRDPRSGIAVEVQFHSEQSQAVKDRYHVEYEVARDLDQPPSVRAAADATMRRAWAEVPHPAGIEQLTVLAGVAVTAKSYPARRPARKEARP